MIQGLNNTINAVVGHLDAIPVPAFIINKEFTILYANKASATMAGVTPKEMLGQKCYDHFKTPDCRSREMCIRPVHDVRAGSLHPRHRHPPRANTTISHTPAFRYSIPTVTPSVPWNSSRT